MGEAKLKKQWRMKGPNFNAWEVSFKEFSAMLNLMQEYPFWIVDSELKYLNIRLDTRDNGFILTDRNKERINPARVMDAAMKYATELDEDDKLRQALSEIHQAALSSPNEEETS